MRRVERHFLQAKTRNGKSNMNTNPSEMLQDNVSRSSLALSKPKISRKKFDETDRQAVIDMLSRHFGVRLQPVGRRRKWLRDDAGRKFWVLGGYEDWHGIPEEMMDAEVISPSRGYIVIAIRHCSTIEVFIGPLTSLVAARAHLSRASQTTGDYQFKVEKKVEKHGTRLLIKQVPNAALSELTTFSFNETEKN